MIDSKKCVGTGKAKGYGCRDLVPVVLYGKANRVYGLGIECGCYKDWLINSDEGQKTIAKASLQGKKIVEKKNKKEKREKTAQQKEDNKTITQLINEAKKPFQKFIRFRDANKSCISCETIKSEIWDGGHFYKAEVYTGLIFNEDNCHKQCRKCNTFLGGNENNYRIGLIERYGEDFVKRLDELSNTKRIYKFTRDELYEIKKYYQKKLNYYLKI